MKALSAFIFQAPLVSTAERPGWLSCWTDGLSLEVNIEFQPEQFERGALYEVRIELADDSCALVGPQASGDWMFAAIAQRQPMKPFYGSRKNHDGAVLAAYPSDSLLLLCDRDKLCAYMLEIGQHYQVTVRKLLTMTPN